MGAKKVFVQMPGENQILFMSLLKLIDCLAEKIIRERFSVLAIKIGYQGTA